MKVKDSDLLYVGSDYVFASWFVEGAPTMSYAFFRDLTDDGITNFVISSITGCWKKYDENTGDLVFDEQYKDQLFAVTEKAEKLLQELNKEGDITWEGNIQFQ